MDAISKKRPQSKAEHMKLVKEYMQLRSPKFNVSVFIDAKYGGVENAEGTWELKELRDMIGANKDGK